VTRGPRPADERLHVDVASDHGHASRPATLEEHAHGILAVELDVVARNGAAEGVSERVNVDGPAGDHRELVHGLGAATRIPDHRGYLQAGPRESLVRETRHFEGSAQDHRRACGPSHVVGVTG
jgi:hypothetical protein